MPNLVAMVGGEGALFSLPRKFQTGKQAKKKAEDMAIQREYLKKVAAQREDAALGGRVREEEVPVEKAPSLLQEHLQKRARREEDGSAAQRPKERLPFDRERVRVIDDGN